MTGSIVLQDELLCTALTAGIEVDGVVLDAAGCAERGIVLEEIREEKDGRITLRIKLKNNGAPFRCGGFRFRRPGKQRDFLGQPNLRIYLEGWTMPSACGSKRFPDTDFEANPEYTPYVVCRPETHTHLKPGVFRAEHLVVVNDPRSGNCFLAGFLTSGRQFGRFEMRLGENGFEQFTAISDCDGMLVETGDTLESETLCFLRGNDGYGLLEAFASLWGEAMGARHYPTVPTGWCSWYYYFSDVTEADMLENTAFLAANRAEYPLEYVQLDDGYQSACGDWLDWNGKFPGGCRFLASEIKKSGFKPALWLAPFLVEDNSKLLKEHPDWMVRNEAGEIDLTFPWRNRKAAILDGTHPEVQQHFTRLFRTLREAGYEYVKLDFLGQSVIPGRRFDQKATRCQALRRGMEAIRAGFGDGFILGCTAPLGSLVGVVDGERIATDITPYWAGKGKIYDEAPTVPNVCRNGINRSYMHRRLWLNDPDTHIARTDNNAMTENEVMLWTCALKMLGGMLLLSDRFETLTPERAALSRWLLSSPDEYNSRPLDFFERTVPSVWLATSRLDGSRLLGFFNFGEEAREFGIEAKELGVEKVRLSDAYTGEEKIGGAEWCETVPAHSCRVYKVE